MLVLLSFLASLLLSCLCFPSVWASITGGDEFLDAHEAGLAVVASRKSALLFSCPRPAPPSQPELSIYRNAVSRDGSTCMHGEANYAQAQGELRGTVSCGRPARSLMPIPSPMSASIAAAGQLPEEQGFYPNPSSRTNLQRLPITTATKHSLERWRSIWTGVRKAKLLIVYHYYHTSRCFQSSLRLVVYPRDSFHTYSLLSQLPCTLDVVPERETFLPQAPTEARSTLAVVICISSYDSAAPQYCPTVFQCPQRVKLHISSPTGFIQGERILMPRHGHGEVDEYITPGGIPRLPEPHNTTSHSLLVRDFEFVSPVEHRLCQDTGLPANLVWLDNGRWCRGVSGRLE